MINAVGALCGQVYHHLAAALADATAQNRLDGICSEWEAERNASQMISRSPNGRKTSCRSIWKGQQCCLASPGGSSWTSFASIRIMNRVACEKSSIQNTLQG